MAPTSIDQLTVTAQALLDTVVAILETTPSGAPASQFLTPAEPAFDCEFVAVQAARLGEAPTSPQTPPMAPGNRNRMGNVIYASYIMYVVRCAPQMQGNNAPTDAAKTASAGVVQRDGWALWNGIRDAQDMLFDDCLGVLFDGGVPIPEQGGMVGWAFQIRATIEGYIP
jgi:hypothetical protein